MVKSDILIDAKLTLSRDAQFGVRRADGLLAARHRRSAPMFLTEKQADLLRKEFASPTTAPEALHRLITEERAPRLREFFELVAQASSAGLLTVHGAEGDGPGAWKARLHPMAALALSIAGLVGLPLAIGYRWPFYPPTNLDWALALLLGIISTTAGSLMAGLVFSWENLRLGAPRWHLQVLFPAWGVDRSWGELCSKKTEYAAHLIRLLPISLAAIVGALLGANWTMPLLALFWVSLLPIGGGPLPSLIQAKWRQRLANTEVSFSLLHRGKGWSRVKAIGRQLESRATWIQLVALALWLGIGFVGLITLFPGLHSLLPNLWPQTLSAQQSIQWGVIVFAGVLIAAVIAAAVTRLLYELERRQGANRTSGLKSIFTQAEKIDLLKGAAELAKFPSLENLGQEEREWLFRQAQPRDVSKGQIIFNEDDPADAFYLIAQGKFEVVKREGDSLKKQRTIGLLGPGDSFGEIALLEQTVRTASVRAATSGVLLVIPREAFAEAWEKDAKQRRLLETFQNAMLLGRLVEFAHWEQSRLMDFAARCTRVTCPPKQARLRRGEPNNAFHIVYDGSFGVFDRDKLLRKLGPGDYFGEVSLLAGPAASADVVALEESRCLTLSRSDFLDFFTRDYRVTLWLGARAEKARGNSFLGAE